MRAYAFTGPESAPARIEGPLRSRLMSLVDPDKVITGAALGLDTIAARLALDLWPNAEHEVIVPNFRHNYALVKELEAEFNVVIRRMPKKTGPLDRNLAMIDACTRLIACPQTFRPYRSGTWHTINAARRRGRPVVMYPIPAMLSGL